MGGNRVFNSEKMRQERLLRKRFRKERIDREKVSERGKLKARKIPRRDFISKSILWDLYVNRKKSVKEIADKLDFSTHKIIYWMLKYGINTRTRSEATYVKRNPNGDPFKIRKAFNKQEMFLFGLGLGLYWGEGNKANRVSIRLGNSDPYLIKKFIEFLTKIYGVDKNNLRFGLQIFSDINPNQALKFWLNRLKIDKSRFQKVIITPSRGGGTYKKKMKNGVLTIYFHNKKLRDILIGELVKLGLKI